MDNREAETDPFDTLLTLEDQYYTEGYTLGLADGSRSGRIEGRLFGLEKGYAKAVEMGRLNGRAAVWKARLPKPATSDATAATTEVKVQCLSGSDRLRRHVERLAELTDPESLETKNTEDAVNEFDERSAGAKAKATLIVRIVGEDGRPSSSQSTGAREGDVGDKVEITRPQSNRDGRGSGSGRQTGEMEDFVGLPQARKAT